MLRYCDVVAYCCCNERKYGIIYQHIEFNLPFFFIFLFSDLLLLHFIYLFIYFCSISYVWERIKMLKCCFVLVYFEVSNLFFSYLYLLFSCSIRFVFLYSSSVVVVFFFLFYLRFCKRFLLMLSLLVFLLNFAPSLCFTLSLISFYLSHSIERKLIRWSILFERSI